MNNEVPDVINPDDVCGACGTATKPLHVHMWDCRACKTVHRMRCCDECCADIRHWQFCEKRDGKQ